MSYDYDVKNISEDDINRIKNLKNIYQELFLELELNEKYNTKYISSCIREIRHENMTHDEYFNLLKLSEEEQYDVICKDPKLASKLHYPSERIQIKACEYDGSLIKHFNNQCEEAKLIACQDVYNLRFINNPTKEMYLIAFQNLKQAPVVDGMKLDANQFEILLIFKRLLRAVYMEEEYIKFLDKKFDNFANELMKPLLKYAKPINDAVESSNEKQYIIQTSLAGLKGVKIIKKLPTTILKNIITTPSILTKVISNFAINLLNDMRFGIRESNIDKIKRTELDIKTAIINNVIIDIQREKRYV